MIQRFSFAALATLVATTVHAGGIGLYEIGTPDVATASAGRAALAMDASTAWGNPAGMCVLGESQLLVGFQPTWFRREFEAAPETDVVGGGGNGGNSGGFVPFVSAFATHRFNEQYSAGLALVSNVDQTLEYDADWVGRYYTQRDEFQAFTVNPTVGVRLARHLSFGVGVSAVFASMNKTAAVNNVLDGLDDGQIRFRDRSVGWGANLGILLEPEQGARIGLTYRSPVTVGFENVASATGVGPTIAAALDSLGLRGGDVNADVTLPQEVLFSLYHPFNDMVAIMFNSGWQRWEEFGVTSVTIADSSSTSFRVNRATEDTWHFAVGLHYALSGPWLLKGGFAYDSAATSDGNRSVDLPVDSQFRFSGGATWDVNEDTALSFGYLLANLGKAPVERDRELAGTLKGEYPTHWGHFVSLSMSRSF